MRRLILMNGSNSAFYKNSQLLKLDPNPSDFYGGQVHFPCSQIPKWLLEL